MPDTGLTVIGGGVVGLAIAARLAPRSPDLVILERHPKHGQETSSRNSEVIHGGMYYAHGSLKARLCVEGNRELYEICERHDVPHKR
jgi:L-2-hydroxyglutarate oxidase LhgO